MNTKTKTILAILAVLGTAAGGATAAAAEVKYDGCHKVPRAHRAACTPVWSKCYEDAYRGGPKAPDCLAAWVRANVPPTPCATDDFVQLCETVKSVRHECRVPWVEVEVSKPYNMQKLLRRAKKLEPVVAAAARLVQSFGQCVGEAGYKEFGATCARELELPKLEKCAAVPSALKAKFEQFVAKLEDLVKTSEAALAEGAKKDGYERKRIEKRAKLALKVLATVEEVNAHPMLKTGVDAAALRGRLEAAQQAAGAALDARKKEIAAEREAKAAEEAKETAANLPKARMRNARLAKKIAAVIGKQWPKDEVKRVILSAKKWRINYVHIGRYRTRQIENRAMSIHVITKVESGKCRLFEVSVYQPHDQDGYGDVLFGGVGGSKYTLCGGEGGGSSDDE